MEDAIDNSASQQTTPPQQDPGYNIAPDNRNTALLIIVIISSVIWAPTLIGLLAGAFGRAVGLAAGIFAIGCSGVGLIVSGGIVTAEAPPVGILLIGVGLFLLGLGVLIFMPFCKFVVGLFKRFFTWLIGALKKLFNNVTAQNSKAVNQNG